MYKLLDNHFGDLNWWPGESAFEVMVGAVLTQNTAWTNVEKAILNLKNKKLLNPKCMVDAPLRSIISAVRPSGYYNAKAKTIKDLSRFLVEKQTKQSKRFLPAHSACNGLVPRIIRPDNLCSRSLPQAKTRGSISYGLIKGLKVEVLRKELLDIKGIGPETADSILCYAFEKPVFVVDAYAKRIFARHGLVPEGVSYASLQDIVKDNFPKKTDELNQFHALIVETGKRYCKKGKPNCDVCPLIGLKGKLVSSI